MLLCELESMRSKDEGDKEPAAERATAKRRSDTSEPVVVLATSEQANALLVSVSSLDMSAMVPLRDEEDGEEDEARTHDADRSESGGGVGVVAMATGPPFVQFKIKFN